MFLGLDANVDPLMGGGLIISVFAAAILGGIGSAPGALAGAFVVGVIEEVGKKKLLDKLVGSLTPEEKRELKKRLS